MSDSTDQGQVTDLGVLEFEVVEENWNDYQLADGIVIRGRLILTRLARPPPDSRVKPYLTASTKLFTTVAPLSLRSTPTGSMSPPEEITDEKINNGFLIPARIIASSEPWNVYRVMETGELIQGKLVLSAAYRVKDRYDRYGEPQYVVESGSLFAPLPKGTPQVRQKP